jgi:hypothetical protein
MSLHSVCTNIDLMKSLGSEKTKSLDAPKKNLVKTKQMPLLNKNKTISKIETSGSFMRIGKSKKCLN